MHVHGRILALEARGAVPCCGGSGVRNSCRHAGPAPPARRSPPRYRGARYARRQARRGGSEGNDAEAAQERSCGVTEGTARQGNARFRARGGGAQAAGGGGAEGGASGGGGGWRRPPPRRRGARGGGRCGWAAAGGGRGLRGRGAAGRGGGESPHTGGPRRFSLSSR